MKEGDSLFYSKGFLTLEKVVSKDHIPNEGFNPQDVATVATFKIHSQNNSTYTAEPLLINQNGNLFSLPDTVTSENIILRINRMENDKVEIGMKVSNTIYAICYLKRPIKSLHYIFMAGHYYYGHRHHHKYGQADQVKPP
jgi:cytochrome c-type biogenesis protein CcmF